jgi:hypothetical protein
MFAGCDTRLLMPPRLSASLKYCVEVTNFIADVSVSFFKVNETMPPNRLPVFWQSHDWGARVNPVKNFVYRRMFFQELCHSLCIAAMLLHTQVKVSMPRITSQLSNGQGCPCCILQKFNFLSQFLFSDNDYTCDQIAVTTQVFGSTMHHEVCAQVPAVVAGQGSKCIVYTK